MTTSNRHSIKQGSNLPADGLIVYDTDQKIHFYYNATQNTWLSMGAFVMDGGLSSGNNFPSGFITTPTSSVSTSFSVGINKSTPTAELDVTGDAKFSGSVQTNGNSVVNGTLTVASKLEVIGFSSNALVPNGAIIMWSGTLIPLGWALCDGGTYNGLTIPDLRGRFIVGMNNTPGAQSGGQFIATSSSGTSPGNAPADGTTLNYGALGNKGGETGHTLSLNEMPAHTHNVTANISNNNVFGFNGGSNSWVGDGTAHSGDPQFLSVTVNETSKGGSQIHENRPPYYVLAYIIKLP